MSAVFPPTTATQLLINTLTSSKIVYLPAISTIGAGKLYSIKDICGNAARSSIFVSTTGLDVLENSARGSTTYALMSTNFQSVLLASDGQLNWMILQNYTANLITRAGFTPTQITGLFAWFDPSDGNTFTLSGTTVTQWRDKSGNAYHMAPLSGLANGVVQTGYQNGRDVVNFSGNNIYRAPTGSGRYPSDVYIVIAIKNIAARSDCVGMGEVGTDSFNSLTLGEHTQYRWHNGSSSFNRTPACVSPVNETSTGFLIMNWSIANNNFLIRRNGTQLVQTAAYTFSLSTNSAFQLGFRHTNLSSPDIAFNAYVAEIVMYTTQLATENQQKVEGYLAWKWGLQASLPAGHPYGTFAP